MTIATLYLVAGPFPALDVHGDRYAFLPCSTPRSDYAGQPIASPPVLPANTYAVPPTPGVPAQVVVQPALEPHHKDHPHEVRVYSHSTFFYWWPVWVTGYIMAAVTRIDGQVIQIGNSEVWMHYSKNLGVLFTLIFFLVILITNVSLRGHGLGSGALGAPLSERWHWPTSACGTIF